MAKKKSNSINAARQLESDVSPILEIHYSDPLFSMAAHPTQPILAQGLATGDVFCTRYNAEALELQQKEKRQEIMKEEVANFKKGNTSQVIKSVSQLKKKWWTIIDDHTNDTNAWIMWNAKRHRGSCRSVLFDPLENSLGQNLYSAGSEGVIKKANTETGKVISKTDISDHINKNDAITKLCSSYTHPFLLSGTENGHILVYDSNNLKKNELKFKVSNVHDDAVNHILAMPAVSAYHYLSIGSTSLCHIDIRKGIVTQSDDQEDELLSMCYATDHINDNKNDTVLVAQGEGVVTIWKNSKNKLLDQLTRIKVKKGVSLDAIIPSMNNDTEEMTNSVWCGDSEGFLHRIDHKVGKIVETRVHSTASKGEVDEIGNLEIDYDYRLISSGMDSLKIWSQNVRTIEEESSDESNESRDESDESDSSSESLLLSDDNQEPQPNKRKSQTIKEPINSKKPKQLTNKQLQNMRQHEHGIRKFEDL